ncbi:competence type IV pilus minor pilin ComGD [Lederbergia citrea]|uniref:competence type IV pilus minor pilin ComGD n=1 Tax=Lederbergia citrea TaxID=2833581 RepID=UPI001BC9AD54|nr:competence type IV pilus minor pilin ComGD [Lederbergia citrea]MBS4176353.1 prepilin-type N-terminal cleavage/methylation domain-containing protein [Lederbergia citrea]
MSQIRNEFLRLSNGHKENGFTLLEILIVICVMTVLLSFSFFTIKSFSELMQKRAFISQIQSDLYYAHSYALSRRETVTVRFSILSNQYEAISGHSREIIVQRKIPKPIKLENSNVPSFIITPEGNVSNFGTVFFRLNDKRLKLTFFIGRGRFLVQE